MKTGKQTTYILLERGTEDKELWLEINKVFGLLGKDGIKYIAKTYPKLLELKQGLEQERENDAY